MAVDSKIEDRFIALVEPHGRVAMVGDGAWRFAANIGAHVGIAFPKDGGGYDFQVFLAQGNPPRFGVPFMMNAIEFGSGRWEQALACAVEYDRTTRVVFDASEDVITHFFAALVHAQKHSKLGSVVVNFNDERILLQDPDGHWTLELSDKWDALQQGENP